MRPLRLVAFGLGAASAMAAIGSVVVHVMARSELTAPRWHRALHPGMIVVFILAVPLFRRLALASPNGRIWSAVLLRAPRWMRTIVNAAAAYCVIEFAVFALKDALSGQTTTRSQDLEMFSAGWIALYLAVLSVCISYLHLDSATTRATGSKE